MAVFILSAETFPSVRKAISLEVDDNILDDTVIGLPIYLGEAERFIMRHLTEAQYEHVDWADEAQYAAILYLASLLAPTIRTVDQEKIAGGGALTYSKQDLEARAAELRSMANDKISDIQKALGVETSTDTNPNFFGVARRRLTY